MKLENNKTRYHTSDQNYGQGYHQRMQESLNNHISDIVGGCFITNLSVELTAEPAAYQNGYPMFFMPEKRIFTYEGYTKSDKWFKLIYCE